MADVNDPGDDGIPDEPREQQDGDDGGMPEPLFDYLVYWHRIYNNIIHRGEVRPVVALLYTKEYLMTRTRPVPFPLNFLQDETWSCGILIALILVVHNGIVGGWLSENAHPYVPWVGRVLGRVLLTVGAAVLSTLSFEIVGSLVGKAFSVGAVDQQDKISTFLIKRFGWGQLDENGEPQRNEDGDFVWARDPMHLREFARNAILGSYVLGYYYFGEVIFKSSAQLFQGCAEYIVSPALYFFFSIPVDFAPEVLSWLSLPTPALDKIQDPRTLWFEYGIPVVIQFWVLVFLWLLRTLFVAKAERLAMLGWRVHDPKMNVVWQLIRATAFHLLSYTAYQLVCGIIVGMKWILPQNTLYIAIIDGPIPIRFLQRLFPEGRIFAAVLLLLSHWLLRYASLLAVRLARSFWMPYILWQTRYSRAGARACWPFFIEQLEKDCSVLLDPTKRVTSRVAMTALFGLGSSWPARLYLSAVVPDD
ncbi:hypothetical protein F5B18DRAFT_166348 [Nemania serpens]|nr:hypothetical protein F5B18DRAFT_166348 [Nemania serpens]